MQLRGILRATAERVRREELCCARRTSECLERRGWLAVRPEQTAADITRGTRVRRRVEEIALNEPVAVDVIPRPGQLVRRSARRIVVGVIATETRGLQVLAHVPLDGGLAGAEHVPRDGPARRDVVVAHAIGGC